MRDPFSDPDTMADLGLSPDDRATLLGERGPRFRPAHNEIGEHGVWDCFRERWALFPQPEWLGETGERAATDEASDREEEEAEEPPCG